MNQDWIDVNFEELLDVAENDGTFTFTFLIRHEEAGYFQCTTSINEIYSIDHTWFPETNIEAAKWYREEIQGTDCDWNLRELHEYYDECIDVNYLDKDYDIAIKSVTLN
jgi:hypothetical protein